MGEDAKMGEKMKIPAIGNFPKESCKYDFHPSFRFFVPLPLARYCYLADSPLIQAPFLVIPPVFKSS